MNARLDIEKFDKILALASSDRDGEALAALRKARPMLNEAGLTFRDIATAPKTVPRRQPAAPGAPTEHLGLKVVILESALNAARAEVLKWNEAARSAKAEREAATASLAARIADLERDWPRRRPPSPRSSRARPRSGAPCWPCCATP